MSTHELKIAAPVVTLPERDEFSFGEQLRAAGAPPLDDVWVQDGMRAASLRLAPGSWRWRVALAAWNTEPQKWEIFTLAEYRNLQRRVQEAKEIPQFGTPMPWAVDKRAQNVLDNVPGVVIQVHAVESDDPFVWAIRAVDGARKCIGAWYGRGTTQRVYVGT